MSGWIYDFRRELESNIWLMPPLYHRVWQWIKYSVNHARVDIPNKDGSTTTIYPGQRATSYRQIAKGVGFYEGKKWKEPNVKTIKSILDWMVKQNMISVEGNTDGTIITVEKWELYQSELVKGNTKRITTATRQKHDLDTNNKELINDELMNKKDIYMAVFDYYLSSGLYAHKSLTDDMKKAIDKSIKELGLDLEYFKRIIDRHSAKVQQTKDKGQYATKKRTLAELFGQKKHNSVSLICTDYLDEVYKDSKQVVEVVDQNPFLNR